MWPAWDNGIIQAKQDGRNEGLNEGIYAAREKSALNMFADKLPIDKIVQYSELSLQAATELGRKHGYIQ